MQRRFGIWRCFKSGGRNILGESTIIDLKREDLFISQYVDLRNRYAQLLLSKPVTVAETKAWLSREAVEVKCLIEKDVMIGAVVLYLSKAGEVALFVKEPKRAAGSQLLRVIERVATEKELASLWAWVLTTNLAAQRTFLKNGYRLERESSRQYDNQLLGGFIYRKMI